ncbi:37233_t:CDS:2 [Gigaspora margarita]|uniref:37233_t:CDS:1 n=1 Tax=Gigaspora margarita TaxID=4874 RepID=A0ABN7UVB9_GIGMA|nr:37233_t:CDS:2 [Gigaspora margarita]
MGRDNFSSYRRSSWSGTNLPDLTYLSSIIYHALSGNRKTPVENTPDNYIKLYQPHDSQHDSQHESN